ncbi:hypothetical protein JCM15519_17060 [Fundidesulfovibrio butyratiphilus]
MSRVIDLNLAKRQDEEIGHQKTSVFEAVETFRDFIAQSGLGRPEIIPDGRIHRFDLPDEYAGKKGGWYLFHPDDKPCPAGVVGAWKLDFKENWSLKANWELSTADRDQLRELLRSAKEARDAERRKEADEAASSATAILTASPDATDDHPYLKRKRVRAFGLKVGERQTLLVPMFDTAGQIRGLQRIKPDGKKLFLKDIDPKGAFGWIDGDRTTIYMAEGYATGASVHMATGSAVAIAFNAGNLEPAAKAVKEVFPSSRLIIAADNDRWTTDQQGRPRNVGVEKALVAGHAVGAQVNVPEFRDLSSRPKDFNDLHTLEGLESVRVQVQGFKIKLADWSLSRLQGKEPPPLKWLVENLFPCGKVVVLAAAGGTGKGLLTLDMAIKVSAGPSQGIDLGGGDLVMGHRINQHGPVIILAAEDDADEIHRRVFGLGRTLPESLYVVTSPDLDEPNPLVVNGPRGPERTPFWDEFLSQAIRIRPGLIIVDPLSCFVHADANDPGVGQFVMALLSSMARKTGAAVIVVHHFAKLKDGIKTPEQARGAIRGAAAIVDHARGAYALWSEADDKARQVCKQLGEGFERGKVVCGCLVKHNYRGDDEIHTYVRGENGLLTRRDLTITEKVREHRPNQFAALVDCIRDWAEKGQPFTKSGKPNGLHERREDLPVALRDLGKHTLERMVQTLLDEGRLVSCVAVGGSGKNRLDVPGGPVAQGIIKAMPGSGE